MTNYYVKDDRTPDAIAAASQLYGKEVGMVKTLSDEMKEARREEIAAAERASTSRIDIYSNERGEEQNRQYQKYMEGSIAENFRIKTGLIEEKVALMQEIAEMRIQLSKEKADNEIAIQKRQAEAQIEYDAIMKKIGAVKASRVKMWIWRILWPVLGAASAALTYFLLFI